MMISMANCLQSSLTLTTQLVDLAVQVSDNLHRLVNRSAELGSFALPATNSVDLSRPAAHLRIDLVAEFALGARGNRLHYELHAACLTHSVLLGTVLSEVTPLPVATGKAVLIEEAHVSRLKSLGVWAITSQRCSFDVWSAAIVYQPCLGAPKHRTVAIGLMVLVLVRVRLGVISTSSWWAHTRWLGEGCSSATDIKAWM
jgi:hypothetical protein